MSEMQNIAAELRESMSRPIVRVVICGEVRSGKSGVLNALLRKNILPDNLGNDLRPTVFAEYSEAPSIEFTDIDGVNYNSVDELKDVPNLALETIQIEYDNPNLSGFEFIEIPMTSAEYLSANQIEMVASADIMVWVTISSQAWRLTEKTIIESLGKARPKTCILAVSRADKLRGAADHGKLTQRLEKECADFFDDIVFVKNAKQQIEQSSNSDDAWAETGAAQITAILDKTSKALYSEASGNASAGASKEADPKKTAPAATVVNKVQATTGSAETEVAKSSKTKVTKATIKTSPKAKKSAAIETLAPAPDPAKEKSAEKPKLKNKKTAASKSDTKAPTKNEPKVAMVNKFEKSVIPLLENLEENVVVGMYLPDQPEHCAVMNGEAEYCQKVGEICRSLSAKWLKAYGAGKADEEEFSVAMLSKTHGLHYRVLPEKASIFLMSDVATLNHGIAQNKLTQICKAISAQD